MEGDKANNDMALEKLKLKRTQNLELLNDKVVVSSVVEFLETENKEIMIEDYYLLFYWKYFIKRELWFLVIRDKNNSDLDKSSIDGLFSGSIFKQVFIKSINVLIS